MQTQSISSGWTLFLKLVLPIMWTTFFGTFVAVILFSEDGAYLIAGGMITPFIARVISLSFLLLGIFFFYWLFMRLKRVDVDNDFMYVTNYFKARRYPYHNIEKIVGNQYLMFRPVTVYFKEAGTFGKKITFLSSKEFRKFLGKRPDVASLMKSGKWTAEG